MGGIPSAGIAPGIPIIGGMRRPTLVGGALNATDEASAGRGLPHLKHTGVAPCKKARTDGNIERIRDRAKRQKIDNVLMLFIMTRVVYGVIMTVLYEEGEWSKSELAHAGKNSANRTKS